MPASVTNSVKFIFRRPPSNFVDTSSPSSGRSLPFKVVPDIQDKCLGPTKCVRVNPETFDRFCVDVFHGHHPALKLAGWKQMNTLECSLCSVGTESILTARQSLGVLEYWTSPQSPSESILAPLRACSDVVPRVVPRPQARSRSCRTRRCACGSNLP